jgi:hypothetical protein
VSDATELVWLVERSVDDRDLVTLTYATVDGERHHSVRRSAPTLSRTPVTAAERVDPGDLDPTPEADRERYRAEARRVRERHDPDDEI